MMSQQHHQQLMTLVGRAAARGVAAVNTYDPVTVQAALKAAMDELNAAYWMIEANYMAAGDTQPVQTVEE